jgi:hypothetical protein
MNNLEVRPQGREVQDAEVSMRCGMKLRVLRHEGSKDRSDGGISYRSNHLVLVGVARYPESEPLDVDTYQSDEVGEQKPVLEPVPLACRKVEVTERDNAVWLVLNRHCDGQHFVVPENPDTHEPVLDNTMRWGGNYADGEDLLEFRLLIGGQTGALPIHDKRVSLANPYGGNDGE